MEEEVKILSEIESKEYLLKIQEEKIEKLEKENEQNIKFKNIFLMLLFIFFPIALLGLSEVLRWEDIKLFILMIPVMGVVFGILYLLGLIVKKIKE